MLVAHKLIDAAYGRDRGFKFDVWEGTNRKDADNIVLGVSQAEKFDFGTLPLELLSETPSGQTFSLPDLTMSEKEFWLDGLIPLPAPLCWFEFTLGGKTARTGLLVCDHAAYPDPDIDSMWSVQRVDLIGDTFNYDGVVLGVARAKCLAFSDWQVLASGNKWIIEQMRKVQGVEAVSSNFTTNILLSIYLALMLNSKTSEVRLERAPPALNKSRARSGKAPLSDHRVVSIVPIQYIKAAEEEGRRTHKPPKLHWRKSHKRHFKIEPLTGRAKWMETERWNGEFGWWVTVIPRYVAGKKELGEITHEYRFRNPVA